MERISKMKQKDLVLLPYPFSDLEHKKVRPALIVSNNTFNQSSSDCVMVPLTSVLRPVDYSISITQKDLASGKLIKDSRVRADKLFCVEKRLVIKRIGSLESATFKRVKEEIFSVL